MTNPDVIKLRTEAQRKYGTEAVMLASDIPRRPAFSSGSIALDHAIGIGGWPSDRVVEVSGQEGCGKTTLGLLTMASFLKAQPDRFGLILDVEHKMTPEWMSQLIDPSLIEDRILYARPAYMEQATNMYLDLVSSGQVSMVLLDSIGGAPSMASTVKDAEKGEVGGNSAAVTRFGRLAATFSDNHQTLTYCTNQLREDMDGFRRHMTPGGRGFKHNCILRVKLHKSTTDKKEAVVDGTKLVIGRKIKATVIKNHTGGVEGRTAEWWFYNVPTQEFGFGIDTVDEVVRLSSVTKVIDRRGGWYYHPGLPADAKKEHKVQGEEALAAAIAADPSLRDTIISEVMAAITTDRNLIDAVAPLDPDAPEEGDI